MCLKLCRVRLYTLILMIFQVQTWMSFYSWFRLDRSLGLNLKNISQCKHFISVNINKRFSFYLFIFLNFVFICKILPNWSHDPLLPSYHSIMLLQLWGTVGKLLLQTLLSRLLLGDQKLLNSLLLGYQRASEWVAVRFEQLKWMYYLLILITYQS